MDGTSTSVTSSSAAATAPRKPGRPTRPPLTEAMIARAALDIIDASDWPSCTMRAIAGHLGVRAPSLYHHVAGQREIVDLVRKLVVSEIHDPAILEMTGAAAMRHFGLAYYRAFARHPNTIQVLSTTPIRDNETLQMYEVFLRALALSGWEKQRSLEALLGLEHLALGFAYEWNAEDLMLDSQYAAEHGAPLLAEITFERTNQAEIAETTFRNLLDRFISMFELEAIGTPAPDPDLDPDPDPDLDLDPAPDPVAARANDEDAGP